MVYCNKCGLENVEYAKYCANCGSKINIPPQIIPLEKEENKGILGYLNLTKWFDSLPENEKTIIRDYYKDSREELDFGNINYTSETQTQFLHGMANVLSSQGESRKIKILIDALNADGTSIDKHFVYNDLISIYRKKADFKTTLKFCHLDINLIEKDNEAKEFLKDCVIPSIDYITEINEYKKLINPLTEIFNKNDVVIQKDLYKYPEFVDKRQNLSSFLYWLNRGGYVIRSKKGNSYEVRLKVPLNKIF